MVALLRSLVMKAAVYYSTGDPDVLTYEDVPDPAVTPDGILMEVKAIGIQGGDVLSRARGVLTSSPHIVGYQSAGIVRAVGANVTNIHVGQRIVGTAPSGSHAQLRVSRNHTSWPIPDDMPFEVAAGIPIEFGTADDCLFEFGHLRAGETVLVQAAAGGVGISAVQLAKKAGATVIGTASSDDRLARLSDFGLDVAINYATNDVAAAVMDATDGRGADLIVDSVGGATLEGSIAALAYRGRISWVGSAGRDPNPPSFAGLGAKNATMTGVYLGAEHAHNPDRAWAMIDALIARVASGDLTVAIDSTFPLSEAAAAHRHIESRRAFGRVVLLT
ncbi:MAG: Alcohol dehydrogenase zinc-binding domain protein [Pseudonocardiales bacterium]|nr:Alcohol dehydrogenase zinc-binding domain protein [Pseudonocardiales bacterium]